MELFFCLSIIKVKLSLCYAFTDPRFLDLSTSWRWVVRFTPRPLYPLLPPPTRKGLWMCHVCDHGMMSHGLSHTPIQTPRHSVHMNVGSNEWPSLVKTGTKPDLHHPPSHLSVYQKGTHYAGIKVFNSLPVPIKDLSHNTKQFKSALKKLFVFPFILYIKRIF
jgi:hypothetical protein